MFGTGFLCVHSSREHHVWDRPASTVSPSHECFLQIQNQIALFVLDPFLGLMAGAFLFPKGICICNGYMPTMAFLSMSIVGGEWLRSGNVVSLHNLVV